MRTTKISVRTFSLDMNEHAVRICSRSLAICQKASNFVQLQRPGESSRHLPALIVPAVLKVVKSGQNLDFFHGRWDVFFSRWQPCPCCRCRAAPRCRLCSCIDMRCLGKQKCPPASSTQMVFWKRAQVSSARVASLIQQHP